MVADMIAPTRPVGRRAGLVRLGVLAGSLALGALLGAIPAGMPSGGAWAQDRQIKGLVDRVDRLQRELSTLQRQVYRGEPPQPPETAPLPGTPSTPEDLGTTATARIELRLSQLEAQIRQLTGEVEEMSYRQGQIRGQIDKLAADMDLRLQLLEQGGAGQALGAGPVGGAPGQLAARPPGSAPPAPDDASPRILGTVPAEDVQAMRPAPVKPASPAASQGPIAGGDTQTAAAYALQGVTPDEQYQAAFNLLSQANYGEAELALRGFVEQNPDHALAGNAKYWLGETYYVRQDYQQAAITFAEGFQQYPDNTKAPDNLLKLGMALSALGSKADACGTFAELLKRYPDAAVTIQQRAKQERQRLGCS